MQLLICYEVIFSGDVLSLAMRPDLMVNITNDAWFGVSAGPWQHLVQAQMRAVEEVCRYLGLPIRASPPDLTHMGVFWFNPAR